ncbi:MAG TPA: NAD(P)/FAD-dependent oxidoreductase [Candidatus Koribacter sp.]
MAETSRKRVIVVGGGFSGLEVVKHLASQPVQVLLLDRKNRTTFQPLLYQVATAGLSPAEIAAPLRSVFAHNRYAEVLLCEVKGFDLDRKLVLTADSELPYDYLVVAAGARHSYFGHDEWEPLAPGLKTIEDALEMRRRVLTAFEDAERAAALHGRHEDINFVIVGGGPTGVELAGTISEVARKALASDFRNIDLRRTRILLVEGGPRVLAAYTPELSQSAEDQLKKLGVEVRTNAVVTEVTAHEVHIGSEVLPSSVTLWAAGVAASPLGRALSPDVDRAGRVPVLPDCSVAGHPEVFVVGDLAASKGENGKLVPGVAPAAMQMGRYVAKTIANDLHTRPRTPFRYNDKGSLATIGRAAAVAQFPKFKLTGYPAWLAWLFIHILFLIGFRNRLIVMIQWAWSYLTYQRSARLITDEVGRLREVRPSPDSLVQVPTEVQAEIERRRA